MSKLLIGVVVVLLAFGWHVYELLGYGRTVYNHRPGVCRRVDGPVNGAEDIEILREEGVAFITSGLLYLQPQRAHIEGKMFLYDFKQNLSGASPVAVRLPIKGDDFDQNNFHPHGLSQWVIDGVRRLCVINHDDEFKHSIEFFDYYPSGPALIHRMSVKHPSLIRPNDLVAVGPDQFIFTNDGTTQTETGNILEAVTGYRGGSVYFWDGEAAHVLIPAMRAPNGIAYDAKHKKLFVLEINRRSLHVYDLAEDKKSVTHRLTVDLRSSCDNLFPAPDGSLFSGCHPLLHQSAKMMEDCEAEVTAASQVLRIKFDDAYTTATVTEPYANDGSEVTGSTIAAVYERQMLIGTVCKGLLHCEIADESVLR